MPACAMELPPVECVQKDTALWDGALPDTALSGEALSGDALAATQYPTRQHPTTQYPTTQHPTTRYPHNASSRQRLTGQRLTPQRISRRCTPPPPRGILVPPYGHRRRLAVPHRASGHGQARAGRARDGARPSGQCRGPLGERCRRHRRRATPRHPQAAAARGAAQRRSHRARHGYARRRADAAPPATAPPARGPDPVEVPGHVLYFQRLAMFAERAPTAAAPARDPVADFFALASEGSSAMRYGALIEVEEFWQSLGVQWGELLYSATLTPGDEAKLVVLDGRWRREADGRERPLQILARMVGTSMLGDLVTALRPELQLDALTLTEPGLEAAAADTVQMVRDRTERMSNALRRRPLGVVDASADAPASGAIRHVRNTTRDRLVTFHFFEPLERFKVMVRS